MVIVTVIFQHLTISAHYLSGTEPVTYSMPSNLQNLPLEGRILSPGFYKRSFSVLLDKTVNQLMAEPGFQSESHLSKPGVVTTVRCCLFLNNVRLFLFFNLSLAEFCFTFSTGPPLQQMISSMRAGTVSVLDTRVSPTTSTEQAKSRHSL